MAAVDSSSLGISRKRVLEGGDLSNELDSKRSNSVAVSGANKKPVLKILIPNHIAGKLIGKGGANIIKLESSHNASIQVSGNREYYPGTKERIVKISAEIEQILKFCDDMLENVLNETQDRVSAESIDFKIVITNAAVGLVMGKGGSGIKALQDESHAKINIVKQDVSSVPGERLLKISGEIEQKKTACSKIIKKMSAEPLKMSNGILKYGGRTFGNGTCVSGNPINGTYAIPMQPEICQSYLSVRPVIPQYSLNFPNLSNMTNCNYRPDINYLGNGCSVINNTANRLNSSFYEQKSHLKTVHVIQMEVPNQMVGAIVGKQGHTINEFARNSGAKINFSGKDEFAPGTKDRILTIKGNKSEVLNAFMLIDQKAAQVEMELSVVNRHV